MSFSPRKLAIVAALQREVSGLIQGSKRIERDCEGRKFTFFEREEMVIVCGGIGLEAARRAAEAVIALYHPKLVQSVGFAGALQPGLRVGTIMVPAVVLDARDGSRAEIAGGSGTLVTFMNVASPQQKSKLAQAYGAQAVDMEAAGVAAAAHAHGIAFCAVKVISDPMNFEMPDMTRFIDGQGRFRTISFATYAALRPWLRPRVATLARDSRKAVAALERHLRHHRPANHMAEAKTR